MSLEHAALVWPDRKPREKKCRAKAHHHHKARSSVVPRPLARIGRGPIVVGGGSLPCASVNLAVEPHGTRGGGDAGGFGGGG